MACKLWHSLAVVLGFLATAVSSPNAAHAQFSIEPLLDRGPIRFGVGLEVQLSKFGTEVVAAATANAVLRDAQTLVSASLPQLNRQLLCSNGRPNAAITSIDLGGGSSLMEGGDLVIAAVVHVRECSVGFYEGDVRISAPVHVKKLAKTVVLEAGPLAINPEGVYAAGFVRVSDSQVTSSVNGKVGPLIAGAVKKLNGWVASTLLEPGLQKFMAQYSLRIERVRLAMNGGDLTLTATLSGQMSIAEADRRLSGASAR